MNALTELPAGSQHLLVSQLVDALRANGVFHTPLALRRHGKPWDEYEMDAINRTREAIAAANAYLANATGSATEAPHE